MKKRCAYCAELIQASANECEHCGKVLRRNQTETTSRKTGIEKWQKGVPSWMIYAAVAFGLLIIFLMYYQASQRLADPTEKPTQSQPAESQGKE